MSDAYVTVCICLYTVVDMCIGSSRSSAARRSHCVLSTAVDTDSDNVAAGHLASALPLSSPTRDAAFPLMYKTCKFFDGLAAVAI